jgi:hypothetical protein
MGGSASRPYILAALARACSLGFATAKHEVQLDGSMTVHDLDGLTTASILNRISYSSHKVFACLHYDGALS